MNAIRIHTQLDSTTLTLPEIAPLLGKRVEIIVLEESPLIPAQPRPVVGIHGRSATPGEWDDFFASQGPLVLDPANLTENYREYDRSCHNAPEL